MVKDKNNFLYNEQLKNCMFCLVLSLVFIIGMILKTFSSSINIISIKNLLFLILPILFLNTIIFMLLRVYKNTIIEDNLFNNKNKNILNILTYIIILFFISIILIINSDTNRINNMYCIFIISFTFLMSSYLIKKIFNYEMEKRK